MQYNADKIGSELVVTITPLKTPTATPLLAADDDDAVSKWDLNTAVIKDLPAAIRGPCKRPRSLSRKKLMIDK